MIHALPIIILLASFAAVGARARWEDRQKVNLRRMIYGAIPWWALAEAMRKDPLLWIPKPSVDIFKGADKRAT